jgi:hemolysin III
LYHGERLNSITHLVGATAALAGFVVIVVLAARQGDPWKIVSFSVYGTTLFLLYLFSTLYHSLRGRAKEIFKKLDHIAIYLLIAGTYTPVTLVTLRGVWGWTIFGVVWSMAIVGILIDALPTRGRRILPLVIYLVMGWLSLAAIKQVLMVMPMTGFWWLLVGGLCYTVGVVFYALDKHVRHFHGVWHLFVLAGSVCHFFMFLLYVL